MRNLVVREAEDLENWIYNRGGPPDTSIKEDENTAYVYSQWSVWRREISAETETQMISKLGQLPSTGRCDALGRLLVELPNVSPEALGHFPLVLRAVPKSSGKEKENKILTSGSRGRTKSRGQGEQLAKMSDGSLTIPDDFDDAEKGTRYTIPSTSIPSSARCSAVEKMTLTVSMDKLTHTVQKLQIGSDATRLELPILTVEYKKASDNVMKGTNQLRIYLTASVKFLQAIGITNVPVYGVQTDGPIVVLPAAVLRDDDVRSFSIVGARTDDIHSFYSSSTCLSD